MERITPKDFTLLLTTVWGLCAGSAKNWPEVTAAAHKNAHANDLLTNRNLLLPRAIPVLAAQYGAEEILGAMQSFSAQFGLAAAYFHETGYPFDRALISTAYKVGGPLLYLKKAVTDQHENLAGGGRGMTGFTDKASCYLLQIAKIIGKLDRDVLIKAAAPETKSGEAGCWNPRERLQFIGLIDLVAPPTGASGGQSFPPKARHQPAP